MENYNNYLTEEELYHYGVKGMKWGVRRYQNEDGSISKADKKKAKQEYKSDNKIAYELGKKATIYGHAAAKSLKRTAKLEQKLVKQYEKDPSGSKRRTQSLKKKSDASAKTSQELTEKYKKLQNLAEKHCDSLMKKYGKEAVSGIKYKDKKTVRNNPDKKFRTMNEKTNKMSDWVIAGAMTLTSAAVSNAMGAKYSLLYVPSTASGKGKTLESELYRNNRKAQKR